MGTTQLNIRLDTQLKADVDAALASMGRSATDTIRTLWLYIQTHAGDPQLIDSTLHQLELKAQAPSRPARKPWEEVDSILRDGLASVGVDSGAMQVAEDEEAEQELYLEAIMERLEERGLGE